jgi:glycosyltransferase involved in cell wall biosynthesis
MIRVLQIIDSLSAGGAERVAVNYANGLVKIIDTSHICVTRQEGVLLESLIPDVGYLFLNKQSVLDVKAVLRLRNYICKHKINIIHAHSTSFFYACLVKLLTPSIKVIWHDHYGNSEFLHQRPKRILQLCSMSFSYIFSVNSQLKYWSEKNLFCKNVKYVKNFPLLNKQVNGVTKLNGIKGKRILCLANLRPQKNHLKLLEAFEFVKSKFKDWTLHCVGKDFKDGYSDAFFSKLKELNLQNHVYFYNSKSDIYNILKQSDIGILVSKSEGLPLAMLEYGLGSLAVISTDVGDCGLLIPNKSFGILLKNDEVTSISESIITYIENNAYRDSCAKEFNKKVALEYSSKSSFNSLLETYQLILSEKIV